MFLLVLLFSKFEIFKTFLPLKLFFYFNRSEIKSFAHTQKTQKFSREQKKLLMNDLRKKIVSKAKNADFVI